MKQHTKDRFTVPFWQRIAVRQARMAVILAVILGNLFAVLQIYNDVSQERHRISEQGSQLSQVFRASAGEAAYRLDESFAREIVTGLGAQKGVVRAEIIDDFGDRLALFVVDAEYKAVETNVLGFLLGRDLLESSIRLTGPKGNTEVGSLAITIDPVLAAPNLLSRVGGLLVSGLFKSLLLSILLGWLFHVMVTRRVLDLVGDVSREEKHALQIQHGDELDRLARIYRHRMDQNTALVAEAQRRKNRMTLANSIGRIGVWEYNTATGAATWDEEMFSLYGIQASDFKGQYRDWTSRVHPEDLPWAEKALHDAVRGEGTFDPTFRVVHPDGAIRYIKASAEVETDATGVEIMIGVNIDVTDLTAALREAKIERARAEQANAAKSQFLANMSHELRTPLNAILGFSQVLDLDLEKNLTEKQREQLHLILKAGYYLLDLVDDILDLSQIECNNIHFDLEQVAVHALIDDGVEEVTKVAQDYGVTIDPLDQSLLGLPKVRGDVRRLRQVLINLLTNAAKFNRKDGSITIKAEPRDNDYVRITVTNTGRGFSSVDRKRLFKRFERGARRADIASEGCGIGLAISKQLVERMGGWIDCESVEGESATFWFTVPTADNRHALVWDDKHRTQDEALDHLYPALFAQINYLSSSVKDPSVWESWLDELRQLQREIENRQIGILEEAAPDLLSELSARFEAFHHETDGLVAAWSRSLKSRDKRRLQLGLIRFWLRDLRSFGRLRRGLSEEGKRREVENVA